MVFRKCLATLLAVDPLGGDIGVSVKHAGFLGLCADRITYVMISPRFLSLQGLE